MRICKANWIAFFVVLLSISIVAGGQGKVEEQLAAPVAEAKYVVSPRGARLAAVIGKRSRFVVIIDGVEGPKLDEIVTPYAAYVDPRPYLREERKYRVDAQRPSALGSQPPDATGKPVTFSRDGRRFAYVGRLGQEWVLMADGKEVLRVPVQGSAARGTIAGNQGTTAMHVEFTGDEGKHLMFAKSATSADYGFGTNFGAYELWVDGQKMPGVFASGTGGSPESVTDPVISRDGAHYAYAAWLEGKKRTVIVDGKDAGYAAEQLQFTSDGRLVGLSIGEGERQVLVDGKPAFAADDIQTLYVAPQGNKILAIAASPDPSGGAIGHLIVDGQKIESSTGARTVVFSPNGRRYAAVCGKPGSEFVVTDGKKGQEYARVDPESVTFSADSQKVGYLAWVNPKVFVVVNDEESDAFDGAVAFRFSPNGKRVAWCGSQQGSFALYVDGKLVRRDPQLRLEKFEFSPEGSRYAISGNDGIYLDGNATGLEGRFAFSPDGKHFVAFGSRRSGAAGAFAPPGQRGLFVDGHYVYGDPTSNVRYYAFTPDSQHLYWLAFEQTKDQPTQPMVNVLYLDGQPVARCDRIDSKTFMDIYSSGNHQLIEPPPAWQMQSDGSLALLAPTGEAIKRLKVTPAAQTSVASMIATAQNSAAQASAAAAKRVENQKAAKEKAEADRKAAYEKARAEKQAEYERRMAERKAAQEKAIAERKAAKEKAAAEKAARK